MELLSNYFWAAFGIAVALYVITNLFMMKTGSGGWTKDKELWTARAMLVAIPYLFVIGVLTVTAYGLAGVLPLTATQVIVGLIVLIIPSMIFSLTPGGKTSGWPYLVIFVLSLAIFAIVGVLSVGVAQIVVSVVVLLMSYFAGSIVMGRLMYKSCPIPQSK